jgi:hypothetical protein
VVFDCKGVLLWDGINGRFRSFEVAECDINPDIFQDIRQLTKERMDPCQAFGEQSVHTVFNGFFIAHVIHEHHVPQLPNTLDAAFALFQTRRIPGQIQINQRTKPLQIQSLARGIGPEE